MDKPNIIFEEAPWRLMRVSMYGTLRASDFYNTVSENYELSVHEDIESLYKDVESVIYL